MVGASTDSPSGALQARSVGLAAQEDAKRLTWTGKVQVPLRCFAALGAEITRIGTPFAVATDKPFTATLARVRLEPITSADSCPAAAR